MEFKEGSVTQVKTEDTPWKVCLHETQIWCRATQDLEQNLVVRHKMFCCEDKICVSYKCPLSTQQFVCNQFITKSVLSLYNIPVSLKEDIITAKQGDQFSLSQN
jgi:hypothetical protein